MICATVDIGSADDPVLLLLVVIERCCHSIRIELVVGRVRRCVIVTEAAAGKLHLVLVWRLLVEAHGVLGRCVYLELGVVGVHWEIDTRLPLHSVHHLGDICRVYVIKLLLVLLLVLVVQVLRDPKVRNLGRAARANEHVAGLEVAMKLVLLQVQEHETIEDLVD